MGGVESGVCEIIREWASGQGSGANRSAGAW